MHKYCPASDIRASLMRRVPFFSCLNLFSSRSPSSFLQLTTGSGEAVALQCRNADFPITTVVFWGFVRNFTAININK